jgi:hypothetical protein
MKPQPRKQCPRCGRQHSRKGVRYCDPCERAVLEEMRLSKYLEDRHIRHATNERATRPTGAR